MEVVDKKTLLDFYQLRTLEPSEYSTASLASNPIVLNENDNLDEITKRIPKEQLNKLLTDQPDEPAAEKRRSAFNLTDPLGFHESILDELIDKDVIDDTRDPKKLKFLVDSKSFNARLFLTTIHREKTYKELQKSVEYLERSLEAEKPRLQRLIGENFQKAIDNKKLLDEVYSEYSMSNLSANITALNESIAKANTSSTMMLNPVFDGMERASEIESFLSLISSNSVLLDLPKKLTKLVALGDFDSILNEYMAGRKVYYSSTKNDEKNKPVLDRIWAEVEDIISDYKKQLWEKLGHVHIENVGSLSAQSESSFLSIIKRLLELGVSENPIPYFLNLEYNYIQESIDGDLTKVQLSRFLKARENLAKAYNSEDSYEISIAALKHTHYLIAEHGSDVDIVDPPLVANLWGFLGAYVSELTEEIITNRFYKFATMIDFFTQDDLQHELPIKNPHSRQHLKLEDYQLKKFDEYLQVLTEKLCSQLIFIFDATSAELGTKTIPTETGQRPLKDAASLDSYGFIPPHTSVLTSLNNCIVLQQELEKTIDKLKNKTSLEYSRFVSTLKTINSNLVNGVLCVLIQDTKRLKHTEDWTTSNTFEGCTKTADYIMNFYQMFIPKLRSLIYEPESELLANVEKQVITSLDIIADNQLECIVTNADDTKDRDFYYPAILSNLSLLKLRLLPRILKIFDTNFGTKYSTSSVDVYGKIEKYEIKVYGDYMSIYKKQIEETIFSGVKNVDWFQFSARQILVSKFILQPINLIILVKSRLLGHNANKNYIMRIELDLINQFIFKLIESLKSIQQFNSSGLLQISVDLRFLVELFQHLNQSGIKEQINLDKLISVSDRFSRKNTKYANEINDIVTSNLQSNRAQIDCFYRL
ncbi:hypothetical protein KL920_005022 [Ogataea angusta]|nr:hypothetical protein KL920_005022 [Ogataea angusta]